MTEIDPRIQDTVRSVYGDNGLGWLNQAAKYSYRKPEQVVAEYVGEPTPLTTSFFRDGNLKRLAEHYEGRMRSEINPFNGTLRIGQVGCSTSQETLSLAALLTQYRVPFTIDAMDISARALNRASQPHQKPPSYHSDSWYFEKYFITSEDGQTIVPSAELTEHIRYKQLDIIQTSLPAGAYDAIVMNNVLWHYPRPTRNVMLANALAGLREEGHFLIEGSTRDTRQNPDYYPWLQTLREYGLHGKDYDYSFLTFMPSWTAWNGDSKRQVIRDKIAELRNGETTVRSSLATLGVLATSEVIRTPSYSVNLSAQVEASKPNLA